MGSIKRVLQPKDGNKNDANDFRDDPQFLSKLVPIQQREAKDTPAFPDIRQWSTDKWPKEPPPRIDYTVDNFVARKTNVILAGGGGVGKTGAMLDLGVKQSLYDHDGLDQWWMGHRIIQGGKFVIVTSEDGADDIRRRLWAMYGDTWRNPNLIILPLVTMGIANRPFWSNVGGYVEETPEWESLCHQLEDIEDVVGVVLDPLQKMAAVDINADPAHGQAVSTSMGMLAERTNATVWTPHHMRKGIDIVDIPSAREAVRGSTALVDGSRVTYAMWLEPENDAKQITSQMGLEYTYGRVINTAVVKHNPPINVEIRTLYREDSGQLRDVSGPKDNGVQKRKDTLPADDSYPLVVDFLRKQAEEDRFYTPRKLRDLHDKFGVGETNFRKYLSSWTAEKKLRELHGKANRKGDVVLMPPVIYGD